MRRACTLWVAMVALAILPALCLAGGDELSGAVFGLDGKPVPGASVQLHYIHDSFGYGNRVLAKGEADEQGKFRLNAPDFTPPTLVLGETVLRRVIVARQPGAAPGVAFVVPGRRDGYEVFLDKGRTLGCTVTEKGGKPAEDAEVRIVEIRDWTPPGCCLTREARMALDGLARELYRGRTDANGRIAFEDVPLGSARVAATHERAGAQGPLDQDDDGEMLVPLVVAGTGVTGTVTDEAAAAPAKEAVVLPAAQTSRDGFWAVTDEAGKFRLGFVQPYALLRGVVVEDTAAAPRFASSVVALAQEQREGMVRARVGAMKERGAAPPDFTLDLTVKPGWVLKGRVTDEHTGEPVAGAAVMVEDAGTTGQGAAVRFATPGRFCRVSGEDGSFQFRLSGSVVLFVGAPPQGSVFAAQRAPVRVEMDEDTALDLKVDLAREELTRVSIVPGDGAPAGIARVNIRCRGGTLSARTDPHGRLDIARQAGGEDARLYAFSGDGRLAALETLRLAGEPLAMRLKPALTGTVAFQDEDGNDIPGFAYVTVMDEAGEEWFPLLRPAAWRGDKPAEEVRVGGLLPGVTYLVSGFVAGHTPAWGGQGVRWRVEAQGAEPKVVLRFRKGAGKAVAQFARVPAEVPQQRPDRQRPAKEDFDKEVESLKDAEWHEQDPVQAHLTWYGVRGGIVLADAEKHRAYRYPNLFGFDTIAVRDIAFARDKVWLGADKGLLAWDRELNSWSRLPGDGVNLDAPVSEVKLDESGMLRVTVGEAGRGQRRFLYNPQVMEWLEVK